MSLLDLVFPKTCLTCGKVGKYICVNCLSKVELLKPVCPYCEKASIDGFTHSKCRRSFGLDGLTSVWDYDGVIKKAIGALKYKYATEVGRELSILFIERIQGKLDVLKDGILVPVPIFWHKENVRGFNQSIEMGKIIAAKMNWGLKPDLLRKAAHTLPQATLSVEDRKKNLKGTFKTSLNNLLNNYSNILLFDDVFTTGSTLKEACNTLKKSGAERVWGLTIAR